MLSPLKKIYMKQLLLYNNQPQRPSSYFIISKIFKSKKFKRKHLNVYCLTFNIGLSMTAQINLLFKLMYSIRGIGEIILISLLYFQNFFTNEWIGHKRVNNSVLFWIVVLNFFVVLVSQWNKLFVLHCDL